MHQVMTASFEPGSFAIAAYLLQSNIRLRKKQMYSCRRMKKFIKKNKHTLLDIAVDEMADPVLDLVNLGTHQSYHYLVKQLFHVPMMESLPLLLYFLVIFITILI